MREFLPYALEVARQLHDTRKALYLDDIVLRWDAESLAVPNRYQLEEYLRPFLALEALRGTGTQNLADKGPLWIGYVFLPRRRQKECPYHKALCLPTRENEDHWILACKKYADLTWCRVSYAPTFLVDLLDPWPRDFMTPTTKQGYVKGLPAALRYFIMQRDGFRCQLCGASPHDGQGITLQVDHKQSRAHGGADDAKNLMTLCDLCNSGKGMQDL